ncbi:MAG: MATE family efflux transporter [Myxococcota bacterium]
MDVVRMTEGPSWSVTLKFGAPLVVGMLFHTAFNLVDMFMISRLDGATTALAAVGTCDMIAALPTVLSNGVAGATVARISQAQGGGDRRGVRRATWQSLLVVLCLSLAFGSIGLLGSPFLIESIMQTKGDTAAVAASYLRISLGGCYAVFMMLQLTAILRAMGHAKAAAALLISGNVLNIFLNVVLIYGPGPAPAGLVWGTEIASFFGIPRLGVHGAAWATLIARTIPLIFGSIWLLQLRDGPRFHRVYLRPIAEELRALFRIAWPASGQMVLRILAVLLVIALINNNYTTATDPSVLTAFSVCLRLETMALFVGMGWGAAASTLVGTNLGAGKPERAQKAGWLSVAYNAVCMLLFTWIFWYYAEPILGFFDDTPAVIQTGTGYLRRTATTYAFMGTGLVLSQAMTGAGATLASMILDGVVVVILVVPAAYLVAEVFSLPCEGLWWVLAGGNVVGALAYMSYFGHGGFLRRNLQPHDRKGTKSRGC